MIACDVAVLGCGWAGALIGYFLTRVLGRNAEVMMIESDEKPGGLMKSVVIKGYTFDVGGSHIIFSRNKELLGKLVGFLRDNVVKHNRRTYVYVNGTLVPYPFENGVYVLPAETRARIAVSFIEALIDMQARREDWKPCSLREWIYGFFGKEIARIYLEPYNSKIWKRDLDTISADWVYTPGRLPIPDWRDVIRSTVGIPTEGYKEQSVFYYPAKGGIQALFYSVLSKALEWGACVKTSVMIEKIRKAGNKWIINNSFEAKKIVSTIPLKSLVTVLNAPEHVIKAAEKLDYNRVVVVGVALKKQAPDHHWVYVPDRDVVFHRYAWISNYSPYNAPRGRSAVIAEITVPPWDKISKERVISETLDGLERIGVIKDASKEVDFTQAWVHEYGYPVYTTMHNKAREEVMVWLREQGITSIGRWGSWHYWNMDRVYNEIENTVPKILQR